MEWYLKCLRQYADFSGRARRKEYWMFILFNAIISFVLGFIDGVLVLNVLSYIYALVIFIPSLAVSVRRLHDIGRCGWWYLLPMVPFIGLSALLAFGSFTSSAAIILGLAALGTGILMLVWFCTDSEGGSNKWGPNPKEEEGMNIEE